MKRKMGFGSGFDWKRGLGAFSEGKKGFLGQSLHEKVNFRVFCEEKSGVLRRKVRGIGDFQEGLREKVSFVWGKWDFGALWGKKRQFSCGVFREKAGFCGVFTFGGAL